MELDPQPPSPFDSSGRVDRVTVPVRWLGGVTVDGPVAPVESDGGFTFRIGDRAFPLRSAGTAPGGLAAQASATSPPASIPACAGEHGSRATAH